ncbi:transcriptional regulator with XRE-family HTH domain [Thermocatellispora tengchongensis]|uniref:Transcriptional regulator with XRE-family HTH domain n=1 Tax=Thermocatellispora tengchongensis TaxID=1073253 RepID=A0A840NZG8_9ACTN|nr:XRE family transcriptional regulator [Thermocatellispora tengchongensis]MBB5130550.1 transcriptional regulator with XRE-family HTH domain [Thermocatellispora tengchongensis]
MTKNSALADRLRAARLARGWAQKDLARRIAEIAAAMDIPMPQRSSLIRLVKSWESGAHRPRDPYPMLISRALEVESAALFGTEPTPVPTLEIPSLAPDADLYERITRVVEDPQRIDIATIEWLERCLAEHRRIEDTLGSRPLLPVVRAQLSTVADLARGATGPLGDRIVGVLAEYAQFVAWMCQDSGDLAAALRWYDRSHAWALEAGDASLAATTLNMKAHQAWSLKDPQRCVRLAEASRWHDGRTSLGVQGMAAQMSARGHAQMGEANQARTRLGEAEELIRRAAEHPDDEPAWMYFYGEHWFLMQRGMAELELGEGRRAAELIERGLSGLPESYRRDRAWFGACLARAHAVEGDAEAAVTVAVATAPDAAAVNPYAMTELRATEHALAEAGARVAAEAVGDALAALGSPDQPGEV